jgi:hypothetical protein
MAAVGLTRFSSRRGADCIDTARSRPELARHRSSAPDAPVQLASRPRVASSSALVPARLPAQGGLASNPSFHARLVQRLGVGPSAARAGAASNHVLPTPPRTSPGGMAASGPIRSVAIVLAPSSIRTMVRSSSAKARCAPDLRWISTPYALLSADAYRARGREITNVLGGVEIVDASNPRCQAGHGPPQPWREFTLDHSDSASYLPRVTRGAARVHPELHHARRQAHHADAKGSAGAPELTRS